MRKLILTLFLTAAVASQAQTFTGVHKYDGEHKWDEQEVGGVNYITLDSMSENNNPEPGDYLLRVHCKKDGTITWEKVHMNTRKNNVRY